MDSNDNYKKILFLETIKTGKTPKRSGLGARLCLLAGFTNPVFCGTRKHVKPLSCTNKHLTNRIDIYKHYNGYYNVGFRDIGNTFTNQLVKLFESYSIKNVLTKYLGEHEIRCYGSYIYIYYSPHVVIDWGLLDKDLKDKYPNKCRTDKRGFVYYNWSK